MNCDQSTFQCTSKIETTINKNNHPRNGKHVNKYYDTKQFFKAIKVCIKEFL